jgi:hypothetical protein
MKTASILAVLFVLGGCSDPYARPHSWNATQANLANLAAQTADWHDLDIGHGDPGSDGQEAAAAVDRLRHGNVKPLPNVTASDISSQTTPAPAQGAAPTEN